MTSVYGRCQLQLAISQTAELVRFLRARGLIQLVLIVVLTSDCLLVDGSMKFVS